MAHPGRARADVRRPVSAGAAWAVIIVATLALVLAVGLAWFAVRRQRVGMATYDRIVEIAGEASDFNREAVEAMETIVPLFEDMISRDPQIAEPLEVNRLVLIAAIRKMRARAVAFDAIHRRDRAGMLTALDDEDFQ